MTTPGLDRKRPIERLDNLMLTVFSTDPSPLADPIKVNLRAVGKPARPNALDDMRPSWLASSSRSPTAAGQDAALRRTQQNCCGRFKINTWTCSSRRCPRADPRFTTRSGPDPTTSNEESPTTPDVTDRAVSSTGLFHRRYGSPLVQLVDRCTVGAGPATIRMASCAMAAQVA